MILKRNTIIACNHCNTRFCVLQLNELRLSTLPIWLPVNLCPAIGVPLLFLNSPEP